MNRTILVGTSILFAVIGISLVGGKKEAVAGYGCHGFPTYSTTHSCWGRPYLLRRPILARHYRACYGCAGCYGCYGCAGCYGVACYGCAGCYGTTVIEYREVPTKATPKKPAKPATAQDKMSQGSNSVVLNVQVPAEARVVINGLSTSSTGSNRRYVSHGLLSGHRYVFKLQAEVEHEGKLTSQTQTVTVEAGQNAKLVFGLPSSVGNLRSVASRPKNGGVRPAGTLQSASSKTVSR